MRYLTLFNLEIVHAYYIDQRCPDFQIEPTPGTQKLLNDCRCILKPLPNGLRILVAVNNENTPFIPLPTNPVFTFHLRLRNPDFGLFTDLADVSQLTAPLYSNELLATSGDLVPVSQEAWFTEQFVVRRPASREPFVLGGRPLESLKTAGAFIVKGLGEKSGHKRYDEEARVIMVNSSKTRPGTPFTVTYPTMPRLARDVFADVEIKYDPVPASLLGNVNSFRITFRSKKARWKYYIVTDKLDSRTTLPSLEDKDKVIFFNAEDRTDLTRTPDPSDEIAARLAKRYPNKQHFRFISSSLLLCQQAVRKNIQFHLNGGKVIDALPNPSLENYCIDIRNAVREHTLYRVIEYFIH
jgi:hypothetical protein